LDFQQILLKSSLELAKSPNAKALPPGKAIEFGNDYKNNIAIEIVPAKSSFDYALKFFTNRIFEMDRGDLYPYSGKYSYYLEIKAFAEESAASAQRKHQGMLRGMAQERTQSPEYQTKSSD
jgi:hypothetical protein